MSAAHETYQMCSIVFIYLFSARRRRRALSLALASVPLNSNPPSDISLIMVVGELLLFVLDEEIVLPVVVVVV